MNTEYLPPKGNPYQSFPINKTEVSEGAVPNKVSGKKGLVYLGTDFSGGFNVRAQETPEGKLRVIGKMFKRKDQK